MKLDFDIGTRLVCSVVVEGKLIGYLTISYLLSVSISIFCIWAFIFSLLLCVCCVL